ncbi:tetratricopeptide repeat protein [candidate division WOR-3 bacterium]|nr:tetratricopeptide repeat protein [candidate division WOR-3 bacterium]
MTVFLVLLVVGQPGPTDPAALKAHALEMRDAGRLDSAVALYDRALAADPADDEARLGKALALSWQGKQDEAFAVYDEIGPESPGYFEAVKGKGRVSGWAGRYREALEWLARAESLVPGDREVLARRAQVLGWSGDHAAALALYRELVELEPGSADYLFGLGQNLEWSGRPMAARRWYRRALELAPGRDEISEASRRVAGAAAPRARLEFADARDDDGEVRGSYREYRFGYEQRLTDRFVPSVTFAWSSNRRNGLGNEYLLARAGLSYRPLAWLGLNAHYRGDLLGFAFKSAALAWELERSWLTWSGEAGRILFEPTLDYGAFSAATALVARPLPGLRLDARAARLQVIDDGNVKTALSAGAGFDILSRPHVALGYTFSFDDFRDDSPRYYSPQGLVTNTIGASFRQRWSRTGLSAEAAGGPNGVREWVARASLSFDQQLPAGITLFAGLNYEQTTGRGRYAYFGLRAGVSRTF